MNWMTAGVCAGLVFVAVSSSTARVSMVGGEPGIAVDTPVRQSAGVVSGTVLADTAGTPLVGALVTVLGPGMSGVTPVSGGFAVETPAGTYGVRFAAEGFYPLVVEAVEVEDGTNTRLTIVMIARPDKN